MKNFLFAGLMIVALVLGSGLRTASASESDVLGWLRSLGSQLTLVQSAISQSQVQNGARLDTVESKLDRIYEACGRGTATTRRVTLAQVNACIDGCFTSTAVGSATEGVVGRQAFIGCVARCPSNTLRNIECASGYLNYASGYARLENGTEVDGGFTAARYARQCAQIYGPAQEAMCRVFADLFRSNLGACLFDQAANTCQADCQRNFRNDAGYVFCQLRCQNRTRAAERFEQLQASGFLTEDGRLNMDATSNATVSPLAPTTQITNPTAPSTSITAPAPATETYSQCVYRCDAERTTCLERNNKSPDCQPTYESCYMGCGSKRT